jgi:DNA-directed RNA polymerase subunit RPC12/RpoP
MLQQHLIPGKQKVDQLAIYTCVECNRIFKAPKGKHLLYCWRCRLRQRKMRRIEWGPVALGARDFRGPAAN